MPDRDPEELFLWVVDDEKISRRTLLRRGLATGVGLTILSSPLDAFARGSKTPPVRASQISMKELIAEAKKEGHLNTIALPPDWANYGEIMSTFQKKYKIGITNDNPDGSSAQENQAVRSLKGDPRAPDVLDVSPSFAAAGANEGLYAKYFTTRFKTVPRAMKDGRGFWVGDYWGVISLGVNQNIVRNVPKSFKDLLKPEYKNQVALNGSPLTSGSALGGVFAAAIANGGSLSNVGPGIDFFGSLKKAGNFIPVQANAQTVASGQTPIVIDWDYLNLAYGKEFPSVRWTTTIPTDGVYGAFYCQAINANAPHPFAARLWQEFLYSDAGQLLWLKGYSHPALFQDLAGRKKIPSALLKALPAPSLYAKVKFANAAQTAKAKALVNAEWAKATG
ncbi:MAG TPA: ABC transporter substrate-binding protein [Gaiellaceae bacterium]|jgi:putative spermidine/putrescine transport system substrate-binding protein